MHKNSFNPELMRFLKTLEIPLNENVIAEMVIEKHYQTNLAKDADDVFRFTALVRNMEHISGIALAKMQKVDPAIELHDNDLMVYSQENNYYLDEKFFSHYTNEDGIFKTVDQVEKAIHFWTKTIAVAVEPEPSN